MKEYTKPEAEIIEIGQVYAGNGGGNGGGARPGNQNKICDICGKSFQSQRDLKDHVAAMHNN